MKTYNKYLTAFALILFIVSLSAAHAQFPTVKMYSKPSAPVNAVAATCVLTVGTSPANGTTLIIDDKTYTFRTSLTGSAVNSILIDSNTTSMTKNIVYAISATTARSGTKFTTGTLAHATVTAVAGQANTLTLTSTVKGADYNDGGANEITVTPPANTTATAWANGVNGTAGNIRCFYYVPGVDYLYYAITRQTIRDANWKRISVSTF